jgi:glycosyltransferase involved in cell wall biosynthesis
MRESDAVVMPSRWEGFGLVALEAMREARAVLAARVGGLAEIVVDGETGLLFTPDDVRSLEDAIVRCAEFDLAGLGLKGRTRFEAAFGAERMAQEIDDVYTACRRVRERPGSTLAAGSPSR